jgi:hypothetical protein
MIMHTGIYEVTVSSKRELRQFRELSQAIKWIAKNCDLRNSELASTHKIVFSCGTEVCFRNSDVCLAINKLLKEKKV